jgi:hypothetical protein
MGRARMARDRVARKLRAQDPVADLKRRLKLEGLPASLAKVRRITKAWWKHHGFAKQIETAGTAEVGKRVGVILLEQSMAEAKRAGIVVLGELVGEHLHSLDLSAFASLLARDHVSGPVFVVPFAVRVLGRILERDDIREGAIYKLSQWRHAEKPWQRHAMCLAFLDLASRANEIDGVTEVILAICASVVWSIDPIDQSAVGVVLRALSRAEPARVVEFFLRYCRFMSRSCVRAAIAGYPPARREELLAHHKRATTLG